MLVKQKDNKMNKRQFNGWIRKNTKLIDDSRGFLYGVSLKEFGINFNLLSTKNKKESIENLIESNQLFERYTGSWVTQSDVEVYNFTQTYDLGLQYGYDYKKML